MKQLKIAAIACIVLVSGLGKVMAQGPQYTIKTNPLPVLWGQIPLTGEYRLMFEAATATNQSAQIGLSYLGPSSILNLENIAAVDSTTGQSVGLSVGGYRLQAQYKFYLSDDRDAPAGFYVSPHVSYSTAKFASTVDKNDYLKATYFNVNALLGYQIIGGEHFAFDMFTGLGFKNNTWGLNEPSSNTFDDEDYISNTGAKISLGFNIGVAF